MLGDGTDHPNDMTCAEARRWWLQADDDAQAGVKVSVPKNKWALVRLHIFGARRGGKTMPCHKCILAAFRVDVEEKDYLLPNVMREEESNG